jgi:oxaloacetate decarboxylase gamma subunit
MFWAVPAIGVGFMTIIEMLGQSGMMSVIGMGIVFSFLIVLIAAVSVAGKLIQILGLDKGREAQAKPIGRGSSNGEPNQQAVIAAIGAAVTRYQKDNA